LLLSLSLKQQQQEPAKVREEYFLSKQFNWLMGEVANSSSIQLARMII